MRRSWLVVGALAALWAILALLFGGEPMETDALTRARKAGL